MRFVLIALLVVCAPLQLTHAQAVAGRITIGNSELAARGTGVMLVDTIGRPRMAAMTDSTGHYFISAPASGKYRVKVQARAGLIPAESGLLILRDGITTTVDLSLKLSGTTLDTVRVVGARELYVSAARPTKYDEFFRRRALGFGVFMTRTDIEKKGMNQTRDLLRGIPGMIIREDGVKSFIQSKRCSGGSIPGLDAAALMGGRAGPDKKQEPMLFVDGVRTRDINSLDDITPGQIEAIEVYQGAAQVPAEAKGDACAAIFVWLRSGD